MGIPDQFVLVAVNGSKALGLRRSNIQDRMFYELVLDELVTDSLPPEWRRGNPKDEMPELASATFKEMGPQVIVESFLLGTRFPQSSTRSAASGRW